MSIFDKTVIRSPRLAAVCVAIAGVCWWGTLNFVKPLAYAGFIGETVFVMIYRIHRGITLGYVGGFFYIVVNASFYYQVSRFALRRRAISSNVKESA